MEGLLLRSTDGLSLEGAGAGAGVGVAAGVGAVGVGVWCEGGVVWTPGTVFGCGGLTFCCCCCCWGSDPGDGLVWGPDGWGICLEGGVRGWDGWCCTVGGGCCCCLLCNSDWWCNIEVGGFQWVVRFEWST